MDVRENLNCLIAEASRVTLAALTVIRELNAGGQVQPIHAHGLSEAIGALLGVSGALAEPGQDVLPVVIKAIVQDRCAVMKRALTKG